MQTTEQPKHTPEPWEVGKNNCVISKSNDGLTISGAFEDDAVKYYGGYLICESVSDNNAQRIVECVNAMAGIKYPRVWMNELIEESRGNDAKKTILILRDEVNRLKILLDAAKAELSKYQNQNKTN